FERCPPDRESGGRSISKDPLRSSALARNESAVAKRRDQSRKGGKVKEGMSGENKFWVSTWAIVGVVAIAISFVIRGCNENDNQLIRDAIERGCSVTVDKQDHHEFECFPKCTLAEECAK